jgi:arylsulfatase A-like enzyme
MTGKHTGHAVHRGNKAIPLTDRTVAERLKSSGYRTAVIGKWGLGEPETAGIPSKRGFDYFFGYLNHHHAHNYYPDYLWQDEKKIEFPGNVVKDNVASKREQYAGDLFEKEALNFLAHQENSDKPFFLFLALTQPHANNEKGKVDGNGMEVPSDEPYTKENWPQPQKNHAAMITRLDATVGKVRQKLKEIKQDEQTYIFFSSDNGPHKEGGADPKFFQSGGPLRGFKRDLTDGGIRVPFMVLGPGIKANSVNDHVCAFWDFVPTAIEIAGSNQPKNLDGISILPTLTGKGKQPTHEFLYWEFHERGSQFAVRMGNWKAIRQRLGDPLELYDIVKDIHEDKNVAAEHPEVIAKIEAYLKTARTEDPNWPLIEPKAKKK